MASGKVRFFNTLKGWGFVTPDSGGQDVFLHVKELRKAGVTTVAEGQALTFQVEPGKEGKPRAINVEVRG